MTTRRANGEGSIRERRPGLWEARYFAADGVQRSVYARTKREVYERFRAARVEAEAGHRPTPARLTTGAWLEEWLATSVRPRLRPSTVASYEREVTTHLAPSLGRIPLARLTPEDIGRMLAKLAATDLSPTSQRYAYSVLRIALGRAEKSGHVSRNVARLVDPPRKSTPEMRALSRGEVGTLFRSLVGRPLEPLILTALGTGLRQGELLALRWCDIDLNDGSLQVRHTLQRTTRELAPPKTARARRTVELPLFVARRLAEHRQAQRLARIAAGAAWVTKEPVSEETDYVFATRIGTPLDSRNVTQGFQAELARAGVPRVTFHAIRHTTATLLLEDGEELGTVSRILGHSDFSTTADVYAHLTRRMLGRAAARLEDVVTLAVSEAN